MADAGETSTETTVKETSVDEVCDGLRNTLASFDDSQDIFRYMVKEAGLLPVMDEAFKEDRFLVKGCISRSWLVPVFEQGRVYWHLDSEALISKGMLALLYKVYQARTPEEILLVKPEFWQQLGVSSILSMNRRNGISHMLRQIYAYAVTFQALAASPEATASMHSTPHAEISS